MMQLSSVSSEHRESAQKPDEDFIIRFKQIYSNVVYGQSSAHGPQLNPSNVDTSEDILRRYSGRDKSFGDAEREMTNFRFRVNEHNNLTLDDTGSTIFNDRAPPKMSDLNFSSPWPKQIPSHPMSFAHQYPNLHTPNPGRQNEMFSSPREDLHAPTAGWNIISPFLLPPSITSGLEDFKEHCFSPHTSNVIPFAQQETYAPSTLVHGDSGYGTMDDVFDSCSPGKLQTNGTSQMPNSTTSMEFPAAFAQDTPRSAVEM